MESNYLGWSSINYRDTSTFIVIKTGHCTTATLLRNQTIIYKRIWNNDTNRIKVIKMLRYKLKYSKISEK